MGVGLCNLIQEYEEENELHGRSIENIDAIESDDKLCGVLEKSGVCIVSDSLESFETMTRYDCILAISKYYDLSELDRIVLPESFWIRRRSKDKPEVSPCDISRCRFS